MSDTFYTPPDYGVDPRVEDLRVSTVGVGKTAVIRTSDRITFKRCRRRWGWNSHLREGLGPKEVANPLWFGTGMHYALEDFHGYQIYGSPTTAFAAYCHATYRNKERVPVPVTFNELRDLGIGMMQYYENWLEDRNPLKTLWIDGKPQVEVRALLAVPYNPKELYPDSPYDEVLYSVTIDRVVEDENGLLWLVDYKSAKQMQNLHYITDPQIGAYYWAASHIYQRPIGGFIYQQHRKDLPQDPRVTAAGRLSVDKRQLTTHRAYRRVLGNIFGSDHSKWPQENLSFLNWMALEETEDSDKFIRRDRVFRNEHSFESEGAKILLEIEDMLNPNLPLYPNPTRECVYMCPFLHACVSMDDGSDWEYELNLAHAKRLKEEDSWRTLLPPVSELIVPEAQVQF